MTALSSLSRAVAAIGDLVLPRVCAACDHSIGLDERDLCAACAAELTGVVNVPYCRHCGESRGSYLLHDARCTRCATGLTRGRFHSFVRVGTYAGPLKELILRFKRSFTVDHFLGSLLAKAIQGAMSPGTIDCWTPIPSHWARKWHLGYQPTALLARSAVAHFGGVVEPLLVMRKEVRPFHERSGITAAQRAKEIDGAMMIGRGSRIAGRHICVVDDVMTTGATLREAAKILKAAGAASVSAAVLARAGHGEPVALSPSGGVDRQERNA